MNKYVWLVMVMITAIGMMVILPLAIYELKSPKLQQRQIDSCRAIGGQPVLYPSMWLKECVLPR